MADVKIHYGDCREMLCLMASKSVHCCVTSPPYWGLRDYGHADQIGQEETPELYVQTMVEVFREVRRVLRDDGTLWLNLGDGYAANRGGTGMPAETLAGGEGGHGDDAAHRGRGTRQQYNPKRDCMKYGLKHKDLVGIPWRVAFALQADGWYLRQDIIWYKRNPMPESVTDRCTKAHEYIFLMSKSPKYYYDAAAIAEPCVANDTRRPYDSPGANALDSRGRQGNGEQRDSWKGSTFGKGKTAEHQLGRAQSDETRGEHETFTRNKRSVWDVTTRPFKGAHFATFPPDLIEPCIFAGCPAGGTVLDPFFGSGTSGMVALKLGRNCVGIELNEADYGPLIEKRIASVRGKDELTGGTGRG
jgi:DNA modification methylase